MWNFVEDQEFFSRTMIWIIKLFIFCFSFLKLIISNNYVNSSKLNEEIYDECIFRNNFSLGKFMTLLKALKWNFPLFHIQNVSFQRVYFIFIPDSVLEWFETVPATRTYK